MNAFTRGAEELLQQVLHLRDAALAAEQAQAERLAALPEARRISARNLLHYLAVRRVDLRPLQMRLAQLGLSSLGYLEPHVLASLQAVATRLAEMVGHTPASPPASCCTFATGARLLQDNATALLNPPRDKRDVRIMVTLDSHDADSQQLGELVAAGMDIARINCAHDEAPTWRRMAALVRAAPPTPVGPALVQIDLAGPKSRTGSVTSQGRVLHLRPQRDLRGRTLAPALLDLWCGDGPVPTRHTTAPVLCAADAQPAIPAVFPDPLTLHFTDTRGRARHARLMARDGALLHFAFDRAAYIEEGMPFSLCDEQGGALCVARFAGVPEVPGVLHLRVGDPLLLTRDDLPGSPGERDEQGRWLTPPQIHCTLEAAFDAAQPGQSVWLDDGRIGAIIESRSAQTLQLRVTHAAPQGSKLRAEKGINFPDTSFDVPALTAKDLDDLSAMASQVDLVALSFLRGPQEVQALREHLARNGREDVGIVLKIENQQAFAQLPAILLEALAHPKVGVMVARGDLAVEMGFERLSEVQQEIIWLCEAAHLPVIWATQILDTLARSGLPSRPEVTDAAMSTQAECAMLNKGPYIADAVRFLCGVLERMEGHYAKRMALRRPLSIAQPGLLEPPATAAPASPKNSEPGP